jgi:hypothetical protein
LPGFITLPPCLLGKESVTLIQDVFSGFIVADTFTMFATTKSPHWSYEKEWRCIGWDSLNDGNLFEFVNILPEEIEAIYFGCKMKKKDQFEIQNLISGDFSHVKLWKAHKHPTRYELSFIAIN